MKFKRILNEAFLDTLPIHKLDKHLLKKMYEAKVDGYTQIDVSRFVQRMVKEFAIDVDRVVRMYITYIKYKDILFSEQGIDIVKEYDTLSPELYDITKETIFRYIEKNYANKVVFDYEGIRGEVLLSESVEFMMEEDITPEVYVSMPVTGSYTSTYKNYRSGEEQEYTTEEVDFYGTVYLSPIPYKTGGELQQLGYDFISFHEEAFGDWMMKVKGRKYSDQIDTGKIKGSFFKPPKNLKEEEIKRVCEQWIEISKRIIRKSAGLLLEYKDFIEHDGGVFEGYNRKSKLI